MHACIVTYRKCMELFLMQEYVYIDVTYMRSLYELLDLYLHI